MHRQAPASTAASLDALGVAHAFLGKGQDPPLTHHVRQVHGTALVEATPARTSAETANRVEADGLYTAASGTTVAVKTADCLPVLVAHPEAKVVMAVHAGWRGLTAGILANALQRAKSLGADLSGLQVVIGPAICRDCYEVGEEVVDAVYGPALGLTPAARQLAVTKASGRGWHLDLSTTAALTLTDQGIDPAHITIIQACTYEISACHSYRRDGKGCGSNWSWIRCP